MMLIVLLEFTAARERAAPWMPAHGAWIRRGIEDGVFVLVGSLAQGAGGAILVQGEDQDALQRRVDADPLVEHGVVSARILAITPGHVDARLDFLRPTHAAAGAGAQA